MFCPCCKQVTGDNTVTLRADYSEQGRFKQPGAVRSIRRTERPRASWSRSFTLPYDVDPDRVYATLEQGVLVVEIKKRPEAVRPSVPRRVVTVSNAPDVPGMRSPAGAEHATSTSVPLPADDAAAPSDQQQQPMVSQSTKTAERMPAGGAAGPRRGVRHSQQQLEEEEEATAGDLPMPEAIPPQIA